MAVRVRPFNSRELARDAESIITSEIIMKIMTRMMMIMIMMRKIDHGQDDDDHDDQGCRDYHQK